MLNRTDWRGIAHLLRKDLTVFTPLTRGLVGGVFVLATVQTFLQDEAFFWLAVGLAAALVAVVPIVEWHLDVDRLVSSLPVKRATIVWARYLSAAFACALAGGAWTITGRLLAPLLAAEGSIPGAWATLDGLLAYSLVVVVLCTLFLPAYFRFGLGRGTAVFAFVCLLLVAVGSTLALGSGPPGQAIRTMVRGWIEARGPLYVIGLVSAAGGSAWVLSAWLAARGLRTRDL